jgi:hypothetical protein
MAGRLPVSVTRSQKGQIRKPTLTRTIHTLIQCKDTTFIPHYQNKVVGLAQRNTPTRQHPNKNNNLR